MRRPAGRSGADSPQVLALLHYASGLALIAATTGLGELARLTRVLRISPEFIVLWAAVYVVGQVTLWWRIARRNAAQDLAPNPFKDFWRE